MDRIIGFLIAFIVGALVGYVNYLISRVLMKKNSPVFTAVSFVRQALQVGCLLLLYFIAPYTPWERWCLLLGGVVGITLMLFISTYRLVKLAGVNNNNVEPDITNGEEDTNG